MMDMSFLAKLMQLNPEGITSLANMAAAKAPPPSFGPAAGGGSILEPGAFAGVLDPTVGQLPQGVQPQMPMGQMAQGVAPGAMQPNPGFDATQANALNQLSSRQTTHFPGAAHFARPGAISMGQVGVPQTQSARPSLAQLIGR